jgi:fructose-bisphosphate aldolase class I
MSNNEGQMRVRELQEIAQSMVTPGKGILAADESTGTITKRLDAINIESTEESRRAYRELLFTTKGANEFISGVILYDETVRQEFGEVTFPRFLESQGILPGIKVDKGVKSLAGSLDETVTEGLDGLRERLSEYFELGCRFAKWRAVIRIGENLPSRYAVNVNAHALARYAALSQEAGLVPIVEPEVLMDGNNSIEQCEEVTGYVLDEVFNTLRLHRVHLEGICLKPNMVISGLGNPRQATVEEVAQATVRCLLGHVPEAVPGIAFLSGGQNDILATRHLNAMNQIGGCPWELSFSYGRALQAPVLEAWKGHAANVPASQEAYLHRAKCNGAARSGSYCESWDGIQV